MPAALAERKNSRICPALPQNTRSALGAGAPRCDPSRVRLHPFVQGFDPGAQRRWHRCSRCSRREQARHSLELWHRNAPGRARAPVPGNTGSSPVKRPCGGERSPAEHPRRRSGSAVRGSGRPHFGDALAAAWPDLHGHAGQEGMRRSRSPSGTAGAGGHGRGRAFSPTPKLLQRGPKAAGQGRGPAGQGRLRAGPRLHDTRVPFALQLPPPRPRALTDSCHSLSQRAAGISPAPSGDGRLL